MILIKHRKFAIRPRLAYFRRVRSPQPAEGCIRPHGEFSWVGTCAEYARDPRGRHVVAKEDHPTLPEGSVHFGKRQPSRGWVSTKGKGEGMRVWHIPSKLRTNMFEYTAANFPRSQKYRKICMFIHILYTFMFVYWIPTCILIHHTTAIFVGKFCNMSVWKYLYLPKIIIKIFYSTDQISHDQFNLTPIKSILLAFAG